jgi:hypothetical protein
LLDKIGELDEKTDSGAWLSPGEIFYSGNIRVFYGEGLVMNKEKGHKLAVFEGRQVRKTFHDGQWWVAIADVVAVLTDSVNPADYLKKIRKRDPELAALFKGGDKLSPP